VKKCLVVGGAGFIGVHLVERLLQVGGRQVVVTGRSAMPKFGLPAEVDYVQVLPEDLDNYARLLDDADEVVDFAYASVPQTSFDDPVRDVLANLPFNVALIKLASERSLKKFIFVSSGGTVYGHPVFLPLNEDHPTNPVSPYGITKLAVEKYGLMYWRLRGLPFVALRPGNPYGPGQQGGLGQGFIATAMRQALAGQPIRLFGERGTVRDYIYIDDLVAGIHAALDFAPAGEVLNIGSGVGLDNREVLEAVQRVVANDGIRLDVHTEPARLFDVSANILDSGRLQSMSGWAPQVPFNDGLAAAWAWIRENRA
jgi:UDP-glucose 4-epimerase